MLGTTALWLEEYFKRGNLFKVFSNFIASVFDGKPIDVLSAT